MALPVIAAAAGVAKGIGSIFSGIGASQQAEAIQAAASAGKERIRAFTEQFTGESKELKELKFDILGESENIFDRLGGFLFGGTASIENLRQAQEDFSALASGDTSGFRREVEASVRGALADTYGLPTGAFENLSAKNLFNFRNQGLQNAMALTEQFGRLGGQLINTEFGVYDQDFNNRLALRQQEAAQLNALDMQAAGVEGTGMAAIGNVFNTAGYGIGSFGQATAMEDAIGFQRGFLTNQYLANLQDITGRALRNTPGYFGGSVGDFMGPKAGINTTMGGFASTPVFPIGEAVSRTFGGFANNPMTGAIFGNMGFLRDYGLYDTNIPGTFGNPFIPETAPLF